MFTSYPDVMMPAYSKSKWNSIFFVSYLSIVLYLLMNLVSRHMLCDSKNIVTGNTYFLSTIQKHLTFILATFKCFLNLSGKF
jgi:hypothetical protein